MKNRILAANFALLLAATSAFAVTDTWDGGGANDNISTALNWVDNTAPVSDLVNTDLIFAGTVRLTPNFSSVFSADSVTFNNTAGAFDLGGSTLTIGTTGIVNNDTNTQTFSNAVSAGTTSVAINAASGALVFDGGLAIPITRTVTLSGSGAVTIANFGAGAGTFNKSNAGALTINASATPIVSNLLLNDGTTTLAATGFTQELGSTGSIAVGAGGFFNINENLTLSSGAQLTGASGAGVSIAGGKTLLVQSGSDLVIGLGVGGSGNVTVTGAGSTYQATGAGLFVNSGRTLAVQSGGSAVSGGELTVAQGTLTVEGTESSVTAATGTSRWGTPLTSAGVTFSNSAAGSFTGVGMAEGSNSSVLAQILSGADITNTGALELGITGSPATLLVSGAGSTWQQNTAATTIGSALFAASSLTVSDGAAFTTSGAMTINATGTVTLDGGTLSVGGTFSTPVTNASAGKIRVDAGKALFFAGAFAANAGELNLQGGTLDFAGAITNSATGFIAGRGALYTGGLTNNGQMAFSGGTADIHGDVTLNAGSRVVTSGAGATTTFFDDVVHNGTEIFTGAGASTVIFGASTGAGPFTGTGTVYSIGDLRPGNSPANVSYGGSLVLGSSTTLTMELGGPAPGTGYDRLDIAGHIDFDGMLNVDLINSFSPVLGSSFDLFNWSTLSGTFAALDLPPLNADLMWNTSLLYSSGTLRVVLAGDYDASGLVDGADYVIWRKSLGQTGVGLAADGDQDAAIDADDFNVWRGHFGQSAGSASGITTTAAIPEPATLMLLIFALAGGRLRRGRIA